MSTTTVGEIPCVDIVRRRGDTKSIDMTIQNSSGAIDITGFTFVLAANLTEEPGDVSQEVFRTNGTIVDGPNGKVSFPIDATAADNTGELYYDVQYTDGSSEILTFLRGRLIMNQDITK